MSAAVDVGADQAEQQADQHHADRLDHRAVRQHDGGDQAEHHQREIVRRVELLRERGQRRAERRDEHGADAAGEERAERRDRRAPRRRGPACAIWWPSMQVTTEDASPGMLTRIDVVEPPYCAP